MGGHEKMQDKGTAFGRGFTYTKDAGAEDDDWPTDCADIINYNKRCNNIPWDSPFSGAEAAKENYAIAAGSITKIVIPNNLYGGKKPITLRSHDEIKKQCLTWGASAMKGCRDGGCIPGGTKFKVKGCPKTWCRGPVKY